MLAYFPTLYHDELLYSGIARYHLNSGNKTQRQTIEDLFGDRLVCATADLPCHLDVLASKIHNLYSSDQLIQDHTLFPYYVYYINQETIAQVRGLIKRGAAHGEAHAILGLLATKVKAPKYLRFCRECFKAEAKVCEPYWHRSHQLPGVSTCPYHKQPLTVSNIDYTTQNHKFEFVALSKIGEQCFPVISVDSMWSEKLENISEQSLSLLLISRLQTKAMPSYKQVLYEQGYMTTQGRVKFNQLIKRFREFYSDELLQHLNCGVTGANETWLHKLIRSPEEIIQPLRHLLILRFLEVATDNSVGHFINSSFGKGPWPCLNKAANHYRLDVIEECKISRCTKTGLPVGTFHCSCGFVYSRRGPDRSCEDKYRIGRIKEFGQVWYGKLEQLNRISLSLRKKAVILGVDPGTIRNQSIVLIDNQEVRHKTEKISMKVNKPFNVMKCSIPGFQKDRVDWNLRDEEMVGVVRRAIDEIRNMPEPQRISVASIARTTAARGFSLKILNNLDKLPKSKSCIASSLDTTETFQIRRLIWAASKLLEKEEKVRGWKLLKFAGLNHPLKKEVLKSFNDLTIDDF